MGKIVTQESLRSALETLAVALNGGSSSSPSGGGLTYITAFDTSENFGGYTFAAETGITNYTSEHAGCRVVYLIDRHDIWHVNDNTKALNRHWRDEDKFRVNGQLLVARDGTGVLLYNDSDGHLPLTYDRACGAQLSASDIGADTVMTVTPDDPDSKGYIMLGELQKWMHTYGSAAKMPDENSQFLMYNDSGSPSRCYPIQLQALMHYSASKAALADASRLTIPGSTATARVHYTTMADVESYVASKTSPSVAATDFLAAANGNTIRFIVQPTGDRHRSVLASDVRDWMDSKVYDEDPDLGAGSMLVMQFDDGGRSAMYATDFRQWVQPTYKITGDVGTVVRAIIGKTAGTAMNTFKAFLNSSMQSNCSTDPQVWADNAVLEITQPTQGTLARVTKLWGLGGLGIVIDTPVSLDTFGNAVSGNDNYTMHRYIIWLGSNPANYTVAAPTGAPVIKVY